jgi:hypothetical protein
MNHVPMERLLEFTPTLGGSVVCPLCICTFPRYVDRQSHILKVHLADPLVDCLRVAHYLSNACSEVWHLSRCILCPDEFGMIIPDEELLKHILVVHLGEPDRLIKLCPKLKRNYRFKNLVLAQTI